MVNHTILLFSMYVVSGTLSIIGSSSILVLIYQDRKTRKMDKRNNYMLLAALSIFDIIVSSVLGYGFIFYPDGKHPWAQGNDNTCMGHTFLLTLGLASTYYNGSLAVYYVLVVKFGKTAEWMYRWAMPSLVGLPAIYAITMTVTCLSLGSYGFDGKFCGWCGWVDNNQALGWAASWGPICFSFVLVIICMAIMVYAIYVNEKKMRDRYDFASLTSSSGERNGAQQDQKNQRIAKLKMTRKMAMQAMWYIGAFFVTYLWSFVANFVKAYGSGDVPFFVLVMRAIFQPLQGFLNFWIFYRGYSKGDRGRNSSRASGRNSSRVSRTTWWSSSKNTSTDEWQSPEDKRVMPAKVTTEV